MNKYLWGAWMEWTDRIGRRIKLRDLHILLAVVQAGSMAKAAAQLSLTQPTISKAIAEMESALGVPLLDRSSKGVEPTRYGRTLVTRSTVVFDELRQGVKEIEFMSDPAIGEVRVGSPDPVGGGLLATAISAMCQRYPRMKFHVVLRETEELFRALSQRTVELVITRFVEGALDDHLSAEVLYRDSFVVVAGASNSWTRRRSPKLSDLVHEPWVLYPRDTAIGAALADAFHKCGVEAPSATVETMSLHLRTSLLATGHFLGALPASVMRFPRHPEIKSLPVELPGTRQPVGMITLKNRGLSPAVELFADLVRQLAVPLSD